ncbi:MAG: hypothetical protein HYT38_01970 [Candidatus Sungbacteria bacterium]|uniref:Uncharacterized protein n=2 Tax=Candidatus Sungiibacteriota bacterium TaxID=2750080 RepID=A0A9D6DR21_9BACT|nr:hypothetical protein [Candidatus Sungbacteria bacterium]
MLNRFNLPQDDKKYSWTRHVVGKMQYYRLSESIVKRIIRAPKRVENGVAENTIACMIPKKSKKPEELWVMYQLKGARKHIITAWRYPGISPVRDQIPIPQDILEELKGII